MQQSTISAALVSPQLVDQAQGLITAYHFVRYSDQRRLDPVRIVRSLAHQLALSIPELLTVYSGGGVDAGGSEEEVGAEQDGDEERDAGQQGVEEAFEQLLVQPLIRLESLLNRDSSSRVPQVVICLGVFAIGIGYSH